MNQPIMRSQISTTTTETEQQQYVQSAKQRLEEYDIPRFKVANVESSEKVDSSIFKNPSSSFTSELDPVTRMLLKTPSKNQEQWSNSKEQENPAASEGTEDSKEHEKKVEPEADSSNTKSSKSTGKEILFIYPNEESLESVQNAYNSAMSAILSSSDHLTIIFAGFTSPKKAQTEGKESKSETKEWSEPSTFKVTDENFEESIQSIRERCPFAADFLKKTLIYRHPLDLKIHKESNLRVCLEQEFKNVHGKEVSYDMVVYPCGDREDSGIENWILENSPVPSVLLRNY